jgi:hypothetical protein
MAVTGCNLTQTVGEMEENHGNQTFSKPASQTANLSIPRLAVFTSRAQIARCSYLTEKATFPCMNHAHSLGKLDAI